MGIRAHQVAGWCNYEDIEELYNLVNNFLASFYKNGYKFVDARFNEVVDNEGCVLHSAQVIYTVEVNNA